MGAHGGMHGAVQLNANLAPPPGFEPGTYGLTARRSDRAELRRRVVFHVSSYKFFF